LLVSKVDPAMALEVFYSYAHADEALRLGLEKALALLRKQELIVGWHDRAIEPGSEWQEQIDSRIRSAQVILLLISPDFIDSSYCYDIELKLALERHAHGEAVVVPIILRPVDWSSAPFAQLQALPRDARPITTWPNVDEAFADVARGIRRVVEHLARRATASAVPKAGAPARSELDAGEAEFLQAFSRWMPALRRAERVALDLIDSRMYVLRPPSSAEDARRKLSDLNDTLLFYNEAIAALKHQWRQHSLALGKLSTPGARELDEAISCARELERWELLPGDSVAQHAVFDDAFAEKHLAIVERYDDFSQGLTGQRDRLKQQLVVTEREARQLLSGPVRPRAAARQVVDVVDKLRRQLLEYFQAIAETVRLLAELSARDDPDPALLRTRITNELTPAVLTLNDKVMWLYDNCAVFAFELRGIGLPGATSGEWIDFVERLMKFHYERVRQPLHRALVPIYRIDEDRMSAVATPLVRIRSTLRSDESAFGPELRDFQRNAEAMVQRIAEQLDTGSADR
jgi:TIR domain-containing protein